MHVGPIYSTPELTLVVGNLYSYIVSPKHKVLLKLRRKSTIAANIVDFVFKPSHRLAYEPGQYMEFTLAHPRPDSRGNPRYFTLASSPTEENLRLGVRFYPEGSSFKRVLSRLDNRTTMLAGQVAGDFTLPSIRVFYTLTDTEAIPRNWSGLTARINDSMIRKLVPDYQERTFYLSGPPDMVRATDRMLKHMQVNPNQMKKDWYRMILSSLQKPRHDLLGAGF